MHRGEKLVTDWLRSAMLLMLQLQRTQCAPTHDCRAGLQSTVSLHGAALNMATARLAEQKTALLPCSQAWVALQRHCPLHYTG